MTKGEIDLLCFKGKEIHAYEVKCSNRVAKARHQLRKIRKRLLDEFSGYTEIKLFFFCGASDMIQTID